MRAPGKRRLWLYVGLSAAALLVLLLVSLGLALTWRPAWYQPAALDRARLHEDKTALARLQDDISAALNAGREIRVALTEEQVNRWLAARDELWPEALLDAQGVDQPHVSFLDGAARLAVTLRRGAWGSVAGVVCRPELRGEEIRLHFEHTTLGAVPIASGWVDGLLAGVPATAGVRKPGTNTITLPREWTWPNGKRPCRLREFKLSAGRLEFVLEPVGVLAR